MSTLVLYSRVMNILRMSVTSCSVELFLDILLYEQIFSPTFQCGSYVYLLQMFVHMHINTAVWISAHIVSLHEHRQAYNMDVCILIFWYLQNVTVESENIYQFSRWEEWYHHTCLPSCFLHDASPLLSLMISPVVPASSICWDLHCYWAAPSGRAWLVLSNSAKAQLLSITSLCL